MKRRKRSNGIRLTLARLFRMKSMFTSSSFQLEERERKCEEKGAPNDKIRRRNKKKRNMLL